MTPAENQIRGIDCIEGCVESSPETPVSAAQTGVPATPAGEPNFDIEVVKVEKKWNIGKEEIASTIKAMLLSYWRRGYVALYRHETWGSCREWKFIVMGADGTYLDGEWVDESSRKNAHRWKVMELQEFLAKYAGRELVAYCRVSPSCNKSKEFSFRAIFRVRAG